ncbi:hypothetical protein BJ138DRAFT_773074 [Hygrophoropsis aurantiaca]|uniref:Uncharacterized protein n=1 Tax=Hygrophoropsis aurantiaca TaxID=72124 RepID=A0ACB7ZWW3_9AGAM|nr:hypothetical protein BJ138DRAFT_773074 [Hygrophoropsis aurantiaca]
MKLRSAIEERDMDMRASESNPSFATSSSTSGTSFASASTHGSLASASTYGSLRTVSSQPDSIISSSTSGSESAASQSDSLISSSTSTSAFTSTSEFTAASTSASMTFANSSTSTLTPTAPLRLTKSPNVRPIDLAPAPSSSLPTRSPLPSFSPLRPAHPPVSHQEHDQDLNHENHDQESRLYTSSPTASDTTHSQHDYNQGNITEATAETSLYLTEHESTRLSTLEQHHLGLGEDDSEGEEDGEVGIGLSLLGALAMDDDDDDEMDARTRRSDGGQGIAHGKTSGAGAIPWTKYAPSPNKNMNGMEIPGGHTHESGADREYQGDDGHHANGRHEEQIDDEAEEEVEDEEGYWDRASDIYDDYRYSRYSMASALSKRISAMPGSKRVSTMSKSPLSGNKRASKMSVMTKGSGKSVPPMPSFSPDRPSFENRPSIESRADAPSVYSRPSVYSQVDRPSIYSQADESVYSRPSFEENQRPSFESQSPSQNNHSLASQVRPPFESRPSFESQRSATESQYSEDSHSDSHSQYSRSRSDSRSSTATLSPLTTQFPQPPVSRLRGELWPGAGAIGGGSEEVEGGGGKEQQSKGEKEGEGAGDISFVSQLTNPFDSHETKELACGTQQHDPPTPNPHDNLIQTPTGSTHTNTNPNNTFPISPLLHTSFGSPHSSASELGSRVTSGYTEDDGERHGEHNDDLNVDEHITPGKEGDLRADDSFTSTTLVPSSSSGTATPISTPTPPPVTTALRPRQPSSTQPHPFARTSIFLPHPNAPKAVGAGATSGPLYARPGQQSHPVSQVPNTKSEQHPGVPNPNIPLPKPGFPHLQPASLPNTTPFSIHVLHHIRGSTSAGGIMNPRTVYGRCEPDLAAAMGPVPILFSTNPLPPLPDVLGGVGLGIGGNHMETASVNAMNTGFGGLGDPGPTTVSPGFAAPPNVMGVPTRTMSAGPMGAPSSSFPPPAKAPAPARSSSAVATGGGASDSAPSRPVPRRAMTQDGSRGGLGGILSNRSGPSPDTNANPNANPSTSANIAIPRAGFVPQVGAARPRSRSFSAFGARAPVTNGMLNDIESKK